jgi:hypothetical protein
MSVAVVFGASGISGWGITKALLDGRPGDHFSQVIALTNRPLSFVDSGFQRDDRLQLHSGIDLQGNVDEVVTKLRQDIPSIQKVTHVFYTGKATTIVCTLLLYELTTTPIAFSTSHTDNQLMMKVSNTKMLRTMVEAMENVAPALSFIAVQTGSNVSIDKDLAI